jgi:phage tail sheath protein FI
MPEYDSPSISIEETGAGNRSIDGVATSTAGFLGITERGPATPTFITSFEEYHRIFGGYVMAGPQDRYLTYAIQGYFQNGGRRCYVQRVVGMEAAAAGLTIGGACKITALGPGQWGNRIAVEIASTGPGDLFRISLTYRAPLVSSPEEPTIREEYDSLSADEDSPDYYLQRINGSSRLVTIEKLPSGAPPGDVSMVMLEDGSDGLAQVGSDFKQALDLLETQDEIALLCCPDEHAAPSIPNDLLDQCERLKNRFAILQAPLSVPNLATHRPPGDSRYGAYYLPWLRIRHPRSGAEVVIPAGGHITGIYARTDSERGVHKAPAGEVVRGVLTDPAAPERGLSVLITKEQQDKLNSRGVNVLRYFPGKGILLWGARTMASDPVWKYVNVRRLFIFIEASLQKGTQWVVFEPNEEPLWATVRRTVTDFLTRLWREGMLQGRKLEEAFFVKCDRTTMTQADLENGRLIMVVGIAPIKPAEFIIIRIGQWTGGSEVTE